MLMHLSRLLCISHFFSSVLQMRHGQAIPLFNGGYVPEKGRPVPRSELLDEPNGDLLAREIFPGEKLKLEDVTACFPRAIMDIKECQPDDPVYLSVYVYQSDEWARIFTDVLIDARQRGCDVQVIYVSYLLTLL